jgi:hypothetical protein
MHFDLRLPIGALFTLYGGVLVVYGMLGDPAQYARSLGINVNLMWGWVLLVFGVFLLVARARDETRRRQGPK